MYRMTYNHTGVTGCSARGIAKRETKEELEQLAYELKDSICNVMIEPIDGITEKKLPMDVYEHTKYQQ